MWIIYKRCNPATTAAYGVCYVELLHDVNDVAPRLASVKTAAL